MESCFGQKSSGCQLSVWAGGLLIAEDRQREEGEGWGLCGT
jgi:hypothetical protein